MIFSQVFSLRILLRILPMHFIPRNFSFFTLKIRFYKVYFWINFRLSNHNVTPGSSENPYDEARSAEFDGVGGWTVIKSVL